ncbi:ABC transporter permease [Membranihabitans maritimus]|uniref:ABC transporter permease n=1 Tax=Membranihabitans maritimus TaxID=2904244 RepID=UPI001F016731|nr:FtsX-like permease family protein [Membranihabitans maritimus]
MITVIKLALRNLWRNKRRTLITAASVMFAAFFAIAMSSIQKGTWFNTLEGMLHNYTGYIQVHQKGYWENQSIDLLMDNSPAFKDTLLNAPGANKVLTRLENFALASANNKTKGVLIAGIDPAQANSFSNIEDQLIEGRYLTPDKSEAVIGKDLSKTMQLNVGDTLVAISQGYRGNNAVGQYRITGIADFGTPEFNKQMVYIPLAEAQYFYAAENLLSSFVITTSSIDHIDETVQYYKNHLDTNQYEIMSYEELIPSIIEAQSIDEASSKIILYILYLLIGFGILGTVMMMLKERQYEFGVLKAIGMKSRMLFQMVALEILGIGIIGVVAGSIIALPIVTYFNKNPIALGDKYAETYEQFNMEPLIKAIIDPRIFYEQVVVVFVMVLFISIYPLFSLKKLKPVAAMRV